MSKSTETLVGLRCISENGRVFFAMLGAKVAKECGSVVVETRDKAWQLGS